MSPAIYNYLVLNIIPFKDMVFLILQHTVQFKSVCIDTDTNMLRMCGIISCMCVNGYLRYILDQMHWKLVTTTRFNVLFAILNVKLF